MIIDKDNIKILLVLLIVGLGIGYAYINSDLNINGTAQVNHANWDVHWANIQITDGSVSGDNVTTAPTISNGTTVNFAITLPTPGSFFEITIDAVNAGIIDAMIDSRSLKVNGSVGALPNYLSSYVTYADGTMIANNQELKANTTETYKIGIKYRDDIDESQLPTTDQTLNISYTVTYRQANENAIAVNHPVTGTVYTVNFADFGNFNPFGPGNDIPTGLTLYSSAEEALAALRLATGDDNINFYLKHVVASGIVEESYLDFIITPEMALANPGMTAGTYELRGGVPEDGLVSKPVSEANSQVLLTAFGSQNCTTWEGSIGCEASGISAVSNDQGIVYAYDDYWYCMASGNSYCDEGWPVF